MHILYAYIYTATHVQVKWCVYMVYILCLAHKDKSMKQLRQVNETTEGGQQAMDIICVYSMHSIYTSTNQYVVGI